MKGYGWPKSPRVSDFRPKSGQFWYFLASPLLCRLRLPSGANASTKILPILHLYTNVLLSVKRAKNLACLNLLMFATQKILSHPSPLFWLSQKIEVRRRRKSNILHPALNPVFSLFWLPGKSGLWEGENGRLWAVVTISLVWRSHASPSQPTSSFTIFNLSLQPQLLWAHFFEIYWYGTIMIFLGMISLPQTCCDSTPLLQRTISFSKNEKSCNEKGVCWLWHCSTAEAHLIWHYCTAAGEAEWGREAALKHWNFSVKDLFIWDVRFNVADFAIAVPRVVEVARRHEAQSPKCLDSDKNFKP